MTWRCVAMLGIAALAYACSVRLADPSADARARVWCSRIIDDRQIGLKSDEFLYRGNWQHVSGLRIGRSRGTSSRSYSVGDLVMLSFRGKCVMIHGILGPNGGPATLAIDGNLHRLNFRSSRRHRAVVFSDFALSDGPHNVVIVVGDRSKAAHRGYVNIDDAVVSQ